MFGNLLKIRFWRKLQITISKARTMTSTAKLIADFQNYGFLNLSYLNLQKPFFTGYKTLNFETLKNTIYVRELAVGYKHESPYRIEIIIIVEIIRYYRQSGVKRLQSDLLVLCLLHAITTQYFKPHSIHAQCIPKTPCEQNA